MREFGEASIESKRITNKLERVCDIQTGVGCPYELSAPTLITA